MQKDEICSAIEEKMKQIYQQIIEDEDNEDKVNTVLDIDDVDKI